MSFSKKKKTLITNDAPLTLKKQKLYIKKYNLLFFLKEKNKS